MTMSPLPANKRKRRFAKIDTEYVEDEDEVEGDSEEESAETEAVAESSHAD
jgi:hypothetical protein